MFQNLKDALYFTLVLAFPDLQWPFEIKMDASQYVIGVILKQGHLVAYHSEALSQTKLNYSIYDKEFHALVPALKQWWLYILGKETILHINHRCLQFLISPTNIQEKIHLKWTSYIQ